MIIALGSKSGVGKDTVGQIIQYLIWKSKVESGEYQGIHHTFDDFRRVGHIGGWQIKKFADKTTQSFEIITGINYHKLDRDEKEKIRPLYVDFAETNKKVFGEGIWVSSLFSEYKPLLHIDNAPYKTAGIRVYETDPNWIVTDLRFSNEFKAVKDRGGITIRIDREENDLEKASNHAHNELVKKYGSDEILWNGENYKEEYQDEFNDLYDKYLNKSFHESENALDNAIFDYHIDNSGTIEELIEKVREILIELKLI